MEPGGILPVFKPQNHTSFDVVARLRKASGIRRIGHAGTLDPMAVGVLPILFGRAAKFADLLPVTDKRYRAKVRPGLVTDTLDITGTVLEERPVSFSRADLEAVLERFRGEIDQVPPMYSAVKKDGVRLYELARRGIETERPARKVRIHELTLLSFEPDGSFELDVLCSKGTYVRSLAADIGEALGCGAVLTELCRTEACGFTLDDCFDLETLLSGDPAAALLPADRALAAYPAVTLSEKQAALFANGVKLSLDRLKMPASSGPLCRVYSESGEFWGLGEPDFDTRQLRVKVLYRL